MLELVRGDCSDGKTCPAIYRVDGDTAVVQGRIVTNGETLCLLGLQTGMSAVEVPAELLAEVADGWPARCRTGHGTLLVSGVPVEDADVLSQLRLAADERAIEVPAAMVAGVLQAC